MDVELTATLAAARKQEWEPWLGAVVEWLDPPMRERTSGPLAGCMVGVKDLIAVAGVPRRCGAPDLTEPAPQREHATAVARLLAAGASVVATLELHQFAYGIICPQTSNPRAPTRVAGGSSGGSAAALAAGLVSGSLGSDTGGSIRIPASCCGVVGLKPTRGLVPLTGVQSLAPSLDTVGAMATTVADTATLLRLIEGHDPVDPYSAEAPARSEPPGVEGMRVGVPVQVRAARMDDDVRAVWERVLGDLAGAGAVVRDIDVPALDGANRANGAILAAEAAWVHADAFARHAERFWPSVRSRLAAGRDLPATTLAAAHHHQARLRAALRARFREVDVLVLPTLPCRAPPVGTDPVEVGGEPEPVVVALTRLTNPWNLAGVPAGSVPAGTDRDGAPVGVQVVGAWFGEPTVVGAMAAIERLSGGPLPVATRPADLPT